MPTTDRHAALPRASTLADLGRSELASSPVTGTATPNRAATAIEAALVIQDVRTIASHFHAADAAWQAGLVAAFGRRASDARYSDAGQGEPGTELRRLYVARYAAYVAWCQANDLPVMSDTIAA